MASEVEETLKRLVAHKGVIGTIVVNTDGVPIKSTLDNATTVQYSGLLNNLVDQAKTMFKELDPTNDLTFLRIRTKVHCRNHICSFSCDNTTSIDDVIDDNNISETRDHGGSRQRLHPHSHTEHSGCIEHVTVIIHNY